MKLVFIYGPPAAGKLAVAKELSKLTGYKVFHNHLTVDLVTSLVDFHNKNGWKLINRYRLELIDLAGKEGVSGMIFTMMYANSNSDIRFMKKVVEVVERNHGRTYFVQLYADLDVIKRRMKSESRKSYVGKLKDIRVLNGLVSEYDLFSPIGFARTLRIDNTKIPAKKAAKMIRAYVGSK